MDDELMEIDEWLRKEIFQQTAYVDQILPSQAGEYIIIAGRSGIGKSILAMQLGFCLANGRSFFGFDVEKAKTGYVCMEGSIENIKDRFEKMKSVFKGYDRKNFLFNYFEPCDLIHSNGKLHRKVNKGCRALIFDNLKQLTSGRYLECAYAKEWSQRFRLFLSEIGAVGILTHHVRKTSANHLLEPGDLESVKGSEYCEEATSVLLLERRRQIQAKDGKFQKVDSSKVNLYFPKLRIATKEVYYLPLRLNRNTVTFEIDNT